MLREKRYEILDILTCYHTLGAFVDDVGVVVMGRIEENKFRMAVTERPHSFRTRVHRAEYFILFSCFGHFCQSVKVFVEQFGVLTRADELEEHLQDARRFG